jgi:phasin family protein
MASKPKNKEAAAAVAVVTAETPVAEAVTPAVAPVEKSPIATTQATVKQGMDKAMKTAEEFLAFGQGNLDAVVKSSQIWAAGVQDISKQVAATAQANFDETMAMLKSLGTVKSPKDVLDLQANLARASMEKAMAETGKITDASLKLAEQAIAPITARLNLAVETFAKVA